MNIITGLVIIACVSIASFTALIITDKVQISGISSSSQIKTLESQLQTVNARIDVLYGKDPQPVATNQIILPQETVDYDKNCVIRNNCVQPESIVVHIGDSVTWTSKDANNGHSIDSGNYANGQCSGGTFNRMILSPGQSSSVKFDKAGQYGYCVSGYSTGEYVHGTIIVQ